MKKIFKKNKKNILLIAIVLIIYAVVFKKFYNALKIDNYKYVLLLLIISLATLIVGLLIYYKVIKKNNKSPHIIFFWIALGFGIIHMVFVPAILGTDELPHFLRPFQIAAGDILVKEPEKNSTLIPKDIASFASNQEMKVRYEKKYIFNKVDYDTKVNLWNGDVTSIGYSPIIYLPQIIGVWMSKILNLSPLFTMFCMRFLNFVTWLILVTYAIKVLPIKKYVHIVMFTSPAFLSLFSTCSADGLATGSMILFISYILKLKYDKPKICLKDIIILSITAIAFCTFKNIYILLLLLLFLIPKACFKSKKYKIIFCFSLLSVCFAMDLGWYILSSPNLVDELGSQQIHYVLSNPLNYAYVLVNSYINSIYYYATNFFAGSEMCYGLVRINELFVISYIIIFIKTFDLESNKIKYNNWERIFVIMIILVIFGLVSSALYSGWTAQRLGIGADSIIGVQSRYFFGLVPLVISLIPFKAKKSANSHTILKYALIVNGIMMIDVFSSLIIRVAS